MLDFFLLSRERFYDNERKMRQRSCELPALLDCCHAEKKIAVQILAATIERKVSSTPKVFTASRVLSRSGKASTKVEDHLEMLMSCEALSYFLHQVEQSFFSQGQWRAAAETSSMLSQNPCTKSQMSTSLQVDIRSRDVTRLLG